jgi:CHAD domain-containing protein/CYTH domain-containing protein
VDPSAGDAAQRSVLDDPAIVGARRVTLHLAHRVVKRWQRLVDAAKAAEATDQADDAGHGGANSADGDGAADDHGDDSAEEVLHGARVSLRTLRSWLDAHDDLVDVPRKTRRRLRASAHATNDWRDGEVLAERLEEMTWPTALAADSARSWAADLRARQPDRAEIASVADDLFRAVRTLRKRSRVVRWKQRVDEPVAPATPFAVELAQRIEDRAEQLRELLAAIDGPKATDVQHEARIAAKRVRYLLEPVDDDLPEGEAAIHLLKELQDVLGELHDLDVADRAADARSPDPYAVGMTSVRATMRASADAAYRTLNECWLAPRAMRTAELFAALEQVVAALHAHAASGVEIERKLLLRALPSLPDGHVRSVSIIDQGYLPGRHITERVRRVASNGTVCHVRTVKAGQGLVRTELEEAIEPALFEQLWPLTEGHRVHKRRTVVVDDRERAWEIDEFLDRELVLAELELPSAEADATPPPWLAPFVDRDVTDEPEYSNARLAR